MRERLPFTWARLVPVVLPMGDVLLLVLAVHQTRTSVLEATIYLKAATCPKLLKAYPDPGSQKY